MGRSQVDGVANGSGYIQEIQVPLSGRIDREELMEIANDLIKFLHNRTMVERFREQPGDKTRLAYARVELSAIQAYASLLKDEELETIKHRLDALEILKAEKQDSGGRA